MLSVRGIYVNGEVKLDERIAVEGRIPVIVTFIEELERKQYGKYHFADLSGKLEWDGDAVAQQRTLRDE
ncbi:MAG: hypothetical protein GY940_16075 [bacterium]|nr:hypothetical protein [bacterium]